MLGAIKMFTYKCIRRRAIISWRRTLEQYFDLVLRIWFLALPRVTRLPEAVQDQELFALLKRDGERAEYVIRQHIGGFHEEIKKIL